MSEIVINRIINDNYRITNNYLEDLKGHGFKIIIEEYDDGLYFYFEWILGGTPKYICEKIKNILIKEYKIKELIFKK